MYILSFPFVYSYYYREFIKGPLIDFARMNPHLQIKLHVQPGRVPRFTGEYGMYLKRTQDSES